MSSCQLFVLRKGKDTAFSETDKKKKLVACRIFEQMIYALLKGSFFLIHNFVLHNLV